MPCFIWREDKLKIAKINLSIDPADLADKFSKKNDMIFLDSCSGYSENIGRFSIISYNPKIGIRARKGITEVLENGEVVEFIKTDPVELIDMYIKRFSGEAIDEKYSYLPFLTGFMGFISYDYRDYIEEICSDTHDDINMWDVYMMYYDRAIIYDNRDCSYHIVASGNFDDENKVIEDILSDIRSNNIMNNSFSVDIESFKSNFEKKEYMDSVKSVKDYIRDGKVYQINLSQRFSVDFSGDSFAYYKALRKINPSPFSAYIGGCDFNIASSSLERFIKVAGNHIETRPIKGTIPRTDSEGKNAINKETLRNSLKDRSELLMIVDLERNDLSKICDTGSVKVPELFSIEEYPTVYHLVSSVVGSLKESISFKEIIHSTFPGGSITGAPKISAMNVIEKLEKNKRGIYTGSIGYYDVRSNVDINIVIRTAVIKEETLYINVGGGIVWDSIEEMEFQETLDKGKALFKAFK
jgi:para-aminobenzoate synthetase component 1